jgi:hypothetical protein
VKLESQPSIATFIYARSTVSQEASTQTSESKAENKQAPLLGGGNAAGGYIYELSDEHRRKHAYFDVHNDQVRKRARCRDQGK